MSKQQPVCSSATRRSSEPSSEIARHVSPQDTEPAPSDQPKANGRIKKSVDAYSLAGELLQFAFIPASQDELDVLRAFAINPVSEELFRDELLFLNLFLVDENLQSMSANHSGFNLVSMHYNNGIESYCALKGFDYSTICERFEVYGRAWNANLDSDPKKRERLSPYWELGKAFSQLVSDGNPDARELSIFGHHFSSRQLNLAIGLAQFEISTSTR
jgi:hypothetical protein